MLIQLLPTSLVYFRDTTPVTFLNYLYSKSGRNRFYICRHLNKRFFNSQINCSFSTYEKTFGRREVRQELELDSRFTDAAGRVLSQKNSHRTCSYLIIQIPGSRSSVKNSLSFVSPLIMNFLLFCLSQSILVYTTGRQNFWVDVDSLLVIQLCRKSRLLASHPPIRFRFSYT